MVRILANGEIVQDDDPRVRNTTQPRSSTPRQSFLNRGHGASLGGPGPRQQQAGARLGAAQSPFNDLNRQLVNMGFPQWHLGNHAVEPVTSILLLFLLMMLGVRGLLLVGLVYLVSHLSQRWPPGAAGGQVCGRGSFGASVWEQARGEEFHTGALRVCSESLCVHCVKQEAEGASSPTFPKDRVIPTSFPWDVFS